MSAYGSWVGREESTIDLVTAAPARLLAATLDRHSQNFKEGDPIPPVWHWLYFLHAVPTSEVGPDGHPPRGGFLPPVPLPRRMRAGGAFEFHRALHVGDEVNRRSRIASVEEKSGSSGSLVFVTVRHELTVGAQVAVIEDENLVYRDAPTQPLVSTQVAKSKPHLENPGETSYATNEVLLFRTSALTFNCHRIHYDRDYARNQEGYPDLVVHGPLIALLMLEHLHRRHAGNALLRFQYRAKAPIFCGEKVVVADALDAATGVTKVVARNATGQDAVSGEGSYELHK